jgi:hypothetical protein
VLCLDGLRQLRREGHSISRRDLYTLKHSGKLPMVNGKTTVEAVLAFYDQQLLGGGTPKAETSGAEHPVTIRNGRRDFEFA